MKKTTIRDKIASFFGKFTGSRQDAIAPSHPPAPAPSLPAQSLVLPRPFPPAWADAWGDDRHGLWIALTYQDARQVFRWIAPGSFLMGSPESEKERWDDEGPQHEVTLTQGYWLADTACTQALWRAVMGNNPSRFQASTSSATGSTSSATGDDRPVEQVSWNNAQDFITKLNQAVPGLNIRLPTEAEWEYACRAGTQTPFWFGDNITPARVNYDGNYPYAGGQKGEYRKQTVDVKALPCNAWGLYQMHGNVWEWCQDRYGAYSAEAVTDPSGPDSGGSRVLRGGSWLNYGRLVRSAYRLRYTPVSRSGDFGFRLARGQ